MKICNIQWLSKEAEEAVVTLEGRDLNLICFCHPCRLKYSAEVEKVYAFNVLGIVASEESQISARRLNDVVPPRYEIVGKVLEGKESVALRDIVIELDIPVPGDILEGDLVKFYCVRLDM